MPLINEASPLETYNSLADRHLVHFFRSARMRKHLIKTGLVTKDGEIRPESEYREIRNRENHKRALLEIIAQAIVERSLEAERLRQGKIRRTLEEICKLHRVRRIKEERQKRAEETILMQLVPRSPRSSEKLEPLHAHSTDNSNPLKDDALIVPVSDIGEPDLAVMDKNAQEEVAKLQRLHRQQRNKKRQVGQPPYLYLREPVMSKRAVSSGPRRREEDRSRSKQQLKEKVTSRQSSINKRSKPQVDWQNYGGQTEPGKTKTKRKNQMEYEHGDLMSDEPQTLCLAENKISEKRSSYFFSRSRSSSDSESIPQNLNALKMATDKKNMYGFSSTYENDAKTPFSDRDGMQLQNAGQEEHRKSTKDCESLYADERRPYTAAMVFSVDKPTRKVPFQSFSDQKDSRRLIHSAKQRRPAVRSNRRKPHAAPSTQMERGGSVCSNNHVTQVDAVITVAKSDERESDQFSDEQVSHSYKNEKIPSFQKTNEVLTKQLLPPIADKMNLVKSPCIVRFMYLGASRYEEAHFRKSRSKSKGIMEHQAARQPRVQAIDEDLRTARYVTVIQQPSGGNTVTVFKGYLHPGDIFEFTSRRAYGYPFSLTLCIDGNQDARISTCCEYRHRRGVRIGGKAGHFVYLNVEGSIPCFKCQAAKSLNQERQRQEKKRQQHRQPESGDTVMKNTNPLDSQDLTVNQASELTTVHPAHSSINMKIKLAEDEDIAKPESSITEYEPVCTNFNRRIAKSTTWECFSPSAAQMQTNMESDWSKIDDNLFVNNQQNDEEQVTDGQEFQQLRSLTNSPSHVTLFSDKDKRNSPLMEIEPSHDNTVNREETDVVYDVDYMEDEYMDEEESTSDSSDEEKKLVDETVEEEPIEHGSLFRKAVHEVLVPAMAQSGRSSRLLTDFKQSLGDIVVEKVDTVYQHRMSTVCHIHMVDSERETELRTQSEHDRIGHLKEEMLSGDIVEKITNFEIYCTDMAEETPVQEYSVAETQGTESSCASGDQQNVDATWLSGFTLVHHQMDIPKEVEARIPLIVVDSDEIDQRFLPTAPKGELTTTFDQAQCSVLETVHSKMTRPEFTIDEHEMTASFLYNPPLSPRSLSRTTASRSITFTSSMSQCKTPFKPPTVSPDIEFQNLDEWNGISTQLNKTNGKASALATETSEFFSVRASPHFVRDGISNQSQCDGYITTTFLHSTAEYRTPDHQSPGAFGMDNSRVSLDVPGTTTVTNFYPPAHSPQYNEKLDNVGGEFQNPADFVNPNPKESNKLAHIPNVFAAGEANIRVSLDTSSEVTVTNQYAQNSRGESSSIHQTFVDSTNDKDSRTQ